MPKRVKASAAEKTVGKDVKGALLHLEDPRETAELARVLAALLDVEWRVQRARHSDTHIDMARLMGKPVARLLSHPENLLALVDAFSVRV
jgi:hypothetical protein